MDENVMPDVDVETSTQEETEAIAPVTVMTDSQLEALEDKAGVLMQEIPDAFGHVADAWNAGYASSGFWGGVTEAGKTLVSEFGSTFGGVTLGAVMGGWKGALAMGVGQYALNAYMQSNPEAADGIKEFFGGLGKNVSAFNAFDENGQRTDVENVTEAAVDAMREIEQEAQSDNHSVVTPDTSQTAPVATIDEEIYYA